MIQAGKQLKARNAPVLNDDRGSGNGPAGEEALGAGGRDGQRGGEADDGERNRASQQR
eukprot:COSAG05_NODE_984_length_6299_cov_4.250323_3_plen_58_part_00